MNKNTFKRLSTEDKFDRKYSCWANNHAQGWLRYKRSNRRTVRRKLKKLAT